MTRARSRVPCRTASRVLVRARLGVSAALVAALSVALAGTPAPAQPGGKPAARPGPDRIAPDKAAPPAPAEPSVIGCPSLANYRMLMRQGAAAAAAALADPKADHLGCAALARKRITGPTERVSLGGRDYDCAGVQGTTACHWMEAGTLPAAPPARGADGH